MARGSAAREGSGGNLVELESTGNEVPRIPKDGDHENALDPSIGFLGLSSSGGVGSNAIFPANSIIYDTPRRSRAARFETALIP